MLSMTTLSLLYSKTFYYIVHHVGYIHSLHYLTNQQPDIHFLHIF